MSPSDANPWLCTREDVKAALDVKYTAFADTRIDQAVGAGSAAVTGQLQRDFVPTYGVRRFDWPPLPTSGAFLWRIWLNRQECISLDSLVSGGITIPPSGYLLEPVNEGPPYNRIDINLATSSAFSAGSTWQQSVVATGLFGATAATTPGGTLAAAVSDMTGTAVTLSDSAKVGVGSLLLVGTERMWVTEKSMATTGQMLQADLAALASGNNLAAQNGAAFVRGETLLLDNERMLIVDIAGNNLTVKRGWDGTTLATHSGSTIYAPRAATVTRGAMGTTAAAHSNGAAINVHEVPPLVRMLAKAEALCDLLGEEAGWARMVGEGENARPAPGGGIKDLRAQVLTRHGRQVRMRAA